jgi:hypothetical protein
MARHCNSSLEFALQRVATDVTATAPGAWTFSLANGAIVPVRARLDGSWLEFVSTAPDSADSVRDDLSWLRLNAFLEGAVRAARPLGVATTQLRTDRHLESADGTLQDNLADMCAELQGAWHGVTEVDRESDRPAVAPPDHLDDQEVETLCTECGWPYKRLMNGDLQIDLETRAGSFRGLLESSCTSGDRLVVQLAELTSPPTASDVAIARLAMALSATVRTVKSALIEREGAPVLAVTSPLHRRRVEALEQAASALAVACQIAGREVRALKDEQLAARYLQLTGVRFELDPPLNEEEHACLSPL